MQDTVKRSTLIVLVVIAMLIFNRYTTNTSVIVYDCNISEISPDFPIEVKEECRRLRHEEWKRENEQKISPPIYQRPLQT
jgi:hypothetical protein